MWHVVIRVTTPEWQTPGVAAGNTCEVLSFLWHEKDIRWATIGKSAVAAILHSRLIFTLVPSCQNMAARALFLPSRTTHALSPAGTVCLLAEQQASVYMDRSISRHVVEAGVEASKHLQYDCIHNASMDLALWISPAESRSTVLCSGEQPFFFNDELRYLRESKTSDGKDSPNLMVKAAKSGGTARVLPLASRVSV